MPRIGVPWNVNCLEFVPRFDAGPAAPPSNGMLRDESGGMAGSDPGDATTEIQLMLDCLTQITLACPDSANCAEQLAVAFQSRLPSGAIISRLADALLEMVSSTPSCVPAAVKLSTCLAQRISARNRPELRLEPHPVGEFPFFCALITALDQRLNQLKERVAARGTPGVAGGALMRYLAGLYVACGSPLRPQARFPLMATCLLQQVQGLLSLHGDAVAHGIAVGALRCCYAALEQDAGAAPEGGASDESVDRRLLDDTWQALRLALAHGRCGSAESALQVLSLLEERAAGGAAGGRPASRQSSVAGGVDMTDEMLDDFEAFLQLSGQLDQ